MFGTNFLLTICIIWNQPIDFVNKKGRKNHYMSLVISNLTSSSFRNKKTRSLCTRLLDASQGLGYDQWDIWGRWSLALFSICSLIMISSLYMFFSFGRFLICFNFCWFGGWATPLIVASFYSLLAKPNCSQLLKIWV